LPNAFAKATIEPEAVEILNNPHGAVRQAAAAADSGAMPRDNRREPRGLARRGEEAAAVAKRPDRTIPGLHAEWLPHPSAAYPATVNLAQDIPPVVTERSWADAVTSAQLHMIPGPWMSKRIGVWDESYQAYQSK
jgi:hypothetical protein